MTKDEALKLALEALSPWAGEDANHTEQYSAYHAIREALANYNPTSDHCMMENAQGELERIRLVQTGVGIGKPEQEPVAWMTPTGVLYRTEDVDGCFDETHIPLYTTPPQRKPLTDEEIDKLPWEPHEGNPMTFAEGLRYFARAIEAAHGIKE